VECERHQDGEMCGSPTGRGVHITRYSTSLEGGVRGSTARSQISRQGGEVLLLTKKK